MNKATAIQLLGGTVTKAAAEMGITASAVSQWPEELPKSALDKVQAALWRATNQCTVGSQPAAAATSTAANSATGASQAAAA